MPNKTHYDIFISYRRVDSGDKAEHLKDLLEPKFKGRISFDRENLTGLFDVALAQRIDVCKDFLLVVGKNSFVFDDKDFTQEQVELYKYLGSCSLQEFKHKIGELGPNAHIDFVRIEIARALHRNDINIIPVVPETTESFSFSKLRLPDDIVGIKRYEAVFYSDNPDALFKDVVTKIMPRLHSKLSNFVKKMLIATSLLLLAVSLCVGLWLKQQNQKQEDLIQSLKIETALDGQFLNWSDNITIEQLVAINDILDNMVHVEGGTFMMGPSPNADGSYDEDVCIELETPPSEQTVASFYMGKYEVTKAQWHAIMEGEYEEADSLLPITNVSFNECAEFAKRLTNLTGLNFRLPTEAEWEYAARGGVQSDGTKYAGSDNPQDVAWYSKNSGGKPHVCEAHNSPMHPNNLDLYDMSGNISEWCNTDFQPYNPDIPAIDSEAKVIRGGNYDSDVSELTVFHRDPMNVYEKTPTVGLRLVITKD